MFNELLLNMYESINGGTLLFWILSASLVLIITEVMFILNIKIPEKQKKRMENDYPVLIQKDNESDIIYVLRCKLGYLMFGIVGTMILLFLSLSLGMIIYYMNKLSIICFIIGIIFFIINYLIYKLIKEKK